MGFTINKCVVSGNLCADPELRQTKGGKAVLSMRLAVNERVKRGEEWVDEPSFLDAVVFGGVAEALARDLGKGSGVAVCGRIKQRSWEGQDGQRRSRVEIVADDVVRLAGRAQPPAAGRARDERPMSVAEAAEYMGATSCGPVASAPAMYDEDIPF